MNIKSVITLLFVALVFAACSTHTPEAPDPLNTMATMKPELVENAPLIYPEEARRQSVQGKVAMLLLVDADGTVREAEIEKSSGSESLDNAAITYGRKLVFKPFTENGRAVVRWVNWSVNFTLNGHKPLVDKLRGVKALLYTYGNGFQHESRSTAVQMMNSLASQYEFNLTIAEDSTYFAQNDLSGYDVLIFISNSGDMVDDDGQQAIEDYIRAGGGFVGIHGASASEYDWEWYGGLLGAFFDDHPKIQTATVKVHNADHSAVVNYPEEFLWTDEWYNWRSLPPDDVTVLLTVDESTYEGGKHEGFHPVAWCREYDGGRSFYTALGHMPEHYADHNFQLHILGAILYASGKN